jgi:hypothetical protein
MSFIEGQKMTLTSGEALVAKRRIKFSASTAVYADAGESANGVTEYGVAITTPVEVRLINGPGTFEMTAAGAIAAGAIIFGAADGKVSLAPSGQPIGIAIEAATADGDIIECILGPVADYPNFAGKTFEVVSANKTLDIQDNGKVMVVDTDGVVITLPATVDGMEFVVMNGGSAVGNAGISIQGPGQYQGHGRAGRLRGRQRRQRDRICHNGDEGHVGRRGLIGSNENDLLTS